MSTEDGSADPAEGSARRRSVQWADGRAATTLNRLHGSAGLNRFDDDTVKGGNDWNNKCFGLAEVDPRVFVVGLNDLVLRKVGDVLSDR